MIPIETPETNVIFGANQEGVNPLPCHKEPNGNVYITWELTSEEILKVAKTKRIYVLIQTFNKPLYPMFLTSENPFINKNE